MLKKIEKKLRELSLKTHSNIQDFLVLLAVSYGCSGEKEYKIFPVTHSIYRWTYINVCWYKNGSVFALFEIESRKDKYSNKKAILRLVRTESLFKILVYLDKRPLLIVNPKVFVIKLNN